MKNVIAYLVYVLTLALTVTGLSSCSVTYQKIPTTDTLCISNELDGTVTLRIWGLGRTFKDATDQAKKNAVNEVIFNGVRNGNVSYTQAPLVSEANARTKYESYFNSFFRDDGPYADFVSNADSRSFSKTMKLSKVQRAVCITIRVLRPQLQQKLRDDGIIQ